MLQDVGKGDDFASAGIKPVADNLVVRVVGGGYVVQCSVLSLLDVQFQQVEAVVDGEVVTGIAQVEGIEAGLSLFEGNLHFAGLQHLVG